MPGRTPELFWSLRGGGGSFGVVTRFDYKRHPVAPQVFCGLMVFPFADAPSGLRKYRQFAARMPLELNVWIVMRKAPPLPVLPESVCGTMVLVCPVFYLGDPADGAQLMLIEPMCRFAPVPDEHNGPMPFFSMAEGVRSPADRGRAQLLEVAQLH